MPYVSPPTQVPIRDDKRRKCWLYTLGVDSGKASIMADLKVEEPGPKYCHFPLGIDRGYDEFYFNGLLSEKLTLTHSGGVDRWRWEKIPGHERNEPLDCRNYAMAALKILNPDLDRIEQSRKQKTEPVKEPDKPKPRKRTRRAVSRKLFDDW